MTLPQTAQDSGLFGAHADAAQRRRCLFEVVTTIKRLGQHDLGVGVPRLQVDDLFQPPLRFVEPVREQRNAPQLQEHRIVLRILNRRSRVEFASLGKLSVPEERSGGLSL
jgi:hypothetical protein